MPLRRCLQQLRQSIFGRQSAKPAYAAGQCKTSRKCSETCLCTCPCHKNRPEKSPTAKRSTSPNPTLNTLKDKRLPVSLRGDEKESRIARDSAAPSRQPTAAPRASSDPPKASNEKELQVSQTSKQSTRCNRAGTISKIGGTGPFSGFDLSQDCSLLYNVCLHQYVPGLGYGIGIDVNTGEWVWSY